MVVSLFHKRTKGITEMLSKQEKNKIFKFKGLGKVIADRLGCTSQYVNAVLNGIRDDNSEMAKKIVQEAIRISESIQKIES